MGNCQAIDAATLVIQHPCGKSDKLYWPVSASEVIKTNPGHYVALLISSALCPGPPNDKGAVATAENQVRVTRIKLLRPTDTLVLGQVYRLITAKEVMKVVSTKKRAKMMREGQEIRVEQQRQQRHETRSHTHNLTDVRNKDNLVMVDKHEKQRQQKPTTTTTTTTSSSSNCSAIGRPKSWQPSLKSISEAV